MPFEVRKKGDHYGVYNLAKRQFAKRVFTTRKAAENMIKAWNKYSHRS